MKTKTALKFALAGAVALVLSATLALAYSPPARAQEPSVLAKFVALMQYIRSEPTPAGVHSDKVAELAVFDGFFTDIYIDGFITPFTGETTDQVKARLQSVPEEDRFIAVMVESYRLVSNPLLLNLIHNLLARYYVDNFTTTNLSGAPAFLNGPQITRLAANFDRSDYAIPAPNAGGDGTATPTPTPTATTADAATINAAYSRFNRQRQALGLNTMTRAVAGDDSFIKVLEFSVGCYANVSEIEDLREDNIEAIGLFPLTGGSECGLRVVFYDHVPLSQRMVVAKNVWDCFKQSRDIRDTNDTSCAGRYSFIDGHVKWLPKQVSYSIVAGQSQRSKFTSLIPWIQQKLNVSVSEACVRGSGELAASSGRPTSGRLELPGTVRLQHMGGRHRRPEDIRHHIHIGAEPVLHPGSEA